MPIPPDLSKPVFSAFPDMADRVIMSLCVCCPREIHNTDFRDAISEKEYGISGLCQNCQDSVFGSDPEEDEDYSEKGLEIPDDIDWDSVEEMFN